MKLQKSQNEQTVAERSLQEFLDFAMSGQAVGDGLPESASPLLKNLWFSMNRRRAGFDWLISRRCRHLRPGMDWLLRWMLTEACVMRALPREVAVSVMVGEAKRRYSIAEAGFLNAVSRRMLEHLSIEAEPYREAPLWVQCELPQSLYSRWRKEHGEAWVREMSQVLQEPAAVTGRRRGCFLGGGVSWPVEFSAYVEESAEEFDLGSHYLQDGSTLMAPLMLQVFPGEVIADLCAAPGGKSLILAECLNGAGTLYACDSSERRLGRLRENLSVFTNVRVLCEDASRPRLKASSLDGLLLDVPCSNTGVIRRRPDVRWNFSVSGLQRVVVQQRRILEGACVLVKEGGRLVYSTCSLEPEENALQVHSFLERHPEFCLEREEQLYPCATHDGGYAALLRRKS